MHSAKRCLSTPSTFPSWGGSSFSWDHFPVHALELAEMSAPGIVAHGAGLLGWEGEKWASEMVSPPTSGLPSCLLALFTCTQAHYLASKQVNSWKKRD